jgi:hypothetical protein
VYCIIGDFGNKDKGKKDISLTEKEEGFLRGI